MANTLYLVRGLPGSGKSTLAQKLVGIDGVVCETDNYFKRLNGGIYKFNPSEIVEAHLWNQKLVQTWMTRAGDFGDKFCIAVANTFTRQWELTAYRELAKTYGWFAVEVTVKTDLTDEQLAVRNVHGVPVDTIRAMRERWEA